MRFAISLLNFRPGKVGGTETYLRRLLEHLPRVAGGDTLVALMHRGCSTAVDTPGIERAILPRGDAVVVTSRCGEAFTPWRDRAAERFVAAARVDAVLYPQQSIYPLCASAPAVLTVHDLQHFEHPENLGGFDRAFRTRVYAASLERSAHIISISEFTAREHARHCHVPQERITVVPHGVDGAPPGTEPWDGAGGPYLFYPAATHPHKAHDVLFRSFAALGRGRDTPHRLVLSGQRTGHWRRLRRLASQLGIADRVIHLGFVPYAQVHALFAGASAVVFPSRYEGFGIPILEAAAAGTRIITSRLPVFEEIGVPAPARIDFEDPRQLADALAASGPTVLNRPPASWATTAERTLDILRRVGRQRPPRSV